MGNSAQRVVQAFQNSPFLSSHDGTVNPLKINWLFSTTANTLNVFNVSGQVNVTLVLCTSILACIAECFVPVCSNYITVCCFGLLISYACPVSNSLNKAL